MRVRHLGLLLGSGAAVLGVWLVANLESPLHALGVAAAAGKAGKSAPPTARIARGPAARPAGVSDGGTSDGCPERMVPFGGVCIDLYEARLSRRAADGTLRPHPAHARPIGGEFVAVSEPGVRPQGYISGIEAASACANAGKRLCSVTEWYRACRGTGDTVYPYGPRFETGRCNVAKPHLLSILFGTNAGAWQYDEHFNAPELNQRPGFLALTGEFAGCVGTSGVYDLVGNLHEWVADRVEPTLASRLPLTDGIRSRLVANTGNGIFMGGFFSTTNQHGRGCAFVTIAHEPAYHDYSTGFRCCRER